MATHSAAILGIVAGVPGLWPLGGSCENEEARGVWVRRVGLGGVMCGVCGVCDVVWSGINMAGSLNMQVVGYTCSFVGMPQENEATSWWCCKQVRPCT
jgi:hypothetical protein